jgi:hypothetical protein
MSNILKHFYNFFLKAAEKSADGAESALSNAGFCCLVWLRFAGGVSYANGRKTLAILRRT